MSLLDGLLLAQSGECRVALAAERRQRRGLLRFQRSDRRAVLAALRPELRCCLLLERRHGLCVERLDGVRVPHLWVG